MPDIGPIAPPQMATPAACVRLAIRIARSTSLQTGIRAARLMHKSPELLQMWIPFVAEFAHANHLPPATVDTLLKPFNEYMVLNLPISERIRLLRQHYTVFREHADPALLRALWEGRSCPLGTIAGRREHYILSAGPTQNFQTRKEGEVTLSLREANATQNLATLTFLLTSSEGPRSGLMVGGVQGPRLSTAKEIIVSATRDMHGLRPRDALLLAAEAIARAVGAPEIWGVSTALHVHNARSERHRRRFQSDYDAFWIERGAHRNWPFGWALPAPFAAPRSGKTAHGRRRDDAKAAIWRIAQKGFFGASMEQDMAIGR